MSQTHVLTNVIFVIHALKHSVKCGFTTQLIVATYFCLDLIKKLKKVKIEKLK